MGPADERATARHHDEHEAVSQALRCFRKIVREYPETPHAPMAAYQGASALERLSNFSPFWRWRDRDAHLMGEAVRLMRFAELRGDPGLAKKGRKYHRVFRQEYTADRMAFAKEKASKRRFRRWEW